MGCEQPTPVMPPPVTFVEDEEVQFDPPAPTLSSNPVIPSSNPGPSPLAPDADSGLALKAIRAVSFSPDGARLARGSADGRIALYDLPSNSELWNHKIHEGACCDLSFTPSGEIVSAGADRQIVMLESGDGRMAATYADHAAAVFGVAVSRDGHWLISGSADQRVLARSLKKDEVHELGRHTGQVMSVDVSPDCRRVASCGQDWAIRIWNLPTFSEEFALESAGGEINAVRFSPRGDRLITGGYAGSIVIWDLAARDSLTNRGSMDGSSVNSACFTLREDSYVYGTSTGLIRMSNMRFRSALVPTVLDAGINDMDLSPDGSILAAGLFNGTVGLFRVGDGLETLGILDVEGAFQPAEEQ